MECSVFPGMQEPLQLRVPSSPWAAAWRSSSSIAVDSSCRCRYSWGENSLFSSFCDKSAPSSWTDEPVSPVARQESGVRIWQKNIWPGSDRLEQGKEREDTRESRRVRERSDNNNLADRACGWLDVFWKVTERDFLRRAFPSPALSVLAIKACTRHLWFKHRNEVERKGGGELRLQWRFKGGKCAGLYTSNFSLPWRRRASYMRSAGTCRGRRRPRSFGLPYPQLLSHGEQRCLCS